MRKRRLSLNRMPRIFGLIMVVFFGPAVGTEFSMSISTPPPNLERTPIGILLLDQELRSYLEAKEFVFQRAWARAVNAFQVYFKTYPAGRYGDEAGFWLAKALDGLAGEERTIERVLDRKSEAVEALNRLAREYPKCPWLEEAQSFRKGLLYQIALVGGRKREAFLAGFLKEEHKTLDQARLDGLDELLTWDRGWAAPVIEDLLKTVADPEGRKRAVRFAARFFPDETETLLRDVAVRDADAGVRTEATGGIERLEMARIPVDVLYYVFSARLTDAAVQAMLPETMAKVFDLTPAFARNNKQAESKADSLFQGKLRKLKMKSGGKLDFDIGQRMGLILDILDGSLGIRRSVGDRVVVGSLPAISRRSRLDLPGLRQRISRAGETGAVKIPAGDVTVTFPLAAYRKTADSFGGQVIFEFSEKKYQADFFVDSRRNQLAAFRRGNDVWLVLLQFESQSEKRPGAFDGPLRARSPLIFKDVMGCRVESNRDSWSLEEIRSRGMIDFGRAKAEIPGLSGRWRLEGFLLADMAKKTFIGRDAELFDPSGKRVAQAAEIVVPAGAPDKYEVVKKGNI